MVTPTQPTVGRIQQTVTFTNTGQPQISYVISFTVGEHGPFTLTIPQAEFSATEVMKRIDELAAKLAAITAPAGA
jgi:hypothetical protein